MTSERKSPAPAGTGGEGKNQNAPQSTDSNDQSQQENILSLAEDDQTMKTLARCIARELIREYLFFKSFCRFHERHGEDSRDRIHEYLKELEEAERGAEQ